VSDDEQFSGHQPEATTVTVTPEIHVPLPKNKINEKKRQNCSLGRIYVYRVPIHFPYSFSMSPVFKLGDQLHQHPEANV
jgi:hypothetical protein